MWKADSSARWFLSWIKSSTPAEITFVHRLFYHLHWGRRLTGAEKKTSSFFLMNAEAEIPCAQPLSPKLTQVDSDSGGLEPYAVFLT